MHKNWGEAYKNGNFFSTAAGIGLKPGGKTAIILFNM